MAKKHEHSPAEPRKSPNPKPGREGTVNVILRGLFLISQRQSAIDVLIPNMGDQHVYRAGNFLCEEDLAPQPLSKPYLLLGVQPERKNAKPFKEAPANIVFQGYRVDQAAGPEAVFARIVLPRPMDIRSRRPMKRPFAAKYDPLGLVHGRTTCLVHILQYRALDIDEVALSGYEPLCPFTYKGKRYVNLHLVSEPDRPLGEEHGRHGFHHTLDLMPGLRGAVKLCEPHPPVGLGDPHGWPEKGVSALETCTVREIYRHLRHAGENWRNGEPYLPEQSDPPMIDEPPLGCLPLITNELAV
jgi:hypothetical protein